MSTINLLNLKSNKERNVDVIKLLSDKYKELSEEIKIINIILDNYKENILIIANELNLSNS